MDLAQIRQLIELMKEHALTEFALEEGEHKIRIRRGLACVEPGMAGTETLMRVPGPTSVDAIVPTEILARPAEPAAHLAEIRSPMVGTFYRAPSPESAPYAEVGKEVDEESVVCIVEAMKVMNEIKAGVSGTVVEALIENGHVVEFGQPLFRVKKRA